jgi:hypothetical protein
LIEDMLGQFSDDGLTASFSVGPNQYRCFARRVTGRGGSRILWGLYEVEEASGEPVRGLTFGFASAARDALADLVTAAEEHSRTGAISGPPRSARTFRPSPQD